jgi:hypothetical protein
MTPERRREGGTRQQSRGLVATLGPDCFDGYLLVQRSPQPCSDDSSLELSRRILDDKRSGGHDRRPVAWVTRLDGAMSRIAETT